MSQQDRRERILSSVPLHERHFYKYDSAFGRLGMRVFEPALMEAPHWHGHIEINVPHAAALTYVMDGRTFSVSPGEIVIFWAGIPHQLVKVSKIAQEPARLANLYVPADTFLLLPHITDMKVALLGGGVLKIPCPRDSWRMMQNWYDDYRSGDVELVESLKMELNALLRRTMAQPLEFLVPPITQNAKGGHHSARHLGHVIAMVRHILENLDTRMTNADVAAVSGLHENYAVNLFSKTIGMPIKRFIIRMRLIRARAFLIESSMPVSEVAIASGFSSITQFYQHFKSSYGVSPKALRDGLPHLRHEQQSIPPL